MAQPSCGCVSISSEPIKINSLADVSKGCATHIFLLQNIPCISSPLFFFHLAPSWIPIVPWRFRFCCVCQTMLKNPRTVITVRLVSWTAALRPGGSQSDWSLILCGKPQPAPCVPGIWCCPRGVCLTSISIECHLSSSWRPALSQHR